MNNEVILENIPEELKKYPQWVCWKAELKDNGEINKIPVDPKKWRKNAKSNNSETWGTFEQAVKTYNQNRGKLAGLGFILSKDDPFSGVDVDKCRNPETGDITSEALTIVSTMKSYTEKSPSDTGLRIITKGKLPAGGRNNRKKKIEMYDSGRFLTITGNKLPNALGTIEERSDELKIIHEKVFGKKELKKPTPLTPVSGIPQSDAELIEKACKAKNGTKFERLFKGNWEGIYDSQSEADQAFCNMLAFWTDCNPHQIKSIFEQSRLYREKSNRFYSTGETYLDRTIQKAIGDVMNTYQPARRELAATADNVINYTEKWEAKQNRNNDNHFDINCLKRNKNGKIKTTIENALLILQNDEALKNKVALNEFSNQLNIKDTLPWGKKDGNWLDSDDAELRYYFESNYNLSTKSKIDDAFSIATSRIKFHPVREYLSGLKWDRKPRLDTLLIDYLGANDNEYTRKVMRKTIVAAVARIYKPGIKFDTMLVLVGSQGVGKSTFFRLLAGDEWFTDDLRMEDMKNKTGPEKMPGKWIVEVAELAGLRKTEVEEVKSFMSRGFDRYREPYGRRPKDQARQCIIVGTTNATEGFLRDQTGNRRFWPVRVNQGERKPWEIEEERDQIWAEAKMYYEAGEKLFLTNQEEQLAITVQEEHTEVSPWFGLVEKYLNEKPGSVVCGIEIWVHALLGDKNKYGRKEQVEINNIMQKMPGWIPGGRERVPEYGRQRVFKRV